MRTPTRNRRRLLSSVALALATAGLFAPSAHAAGFPVWPPGEQAAKVKDRSVGAESASSEGARVPDWQRRFGPLPCAPSCGAGAAAERPPTQIVKPDRFDWGDAGVGAGMSLAAALLAGGVILAARRPQAQRHAGESVATSRGAKEAQA